jgi:hypothetical protein
MGVAGRKVCQTTIVTVSHKVTGRFGAVETTALLASRGQKTAGRGTVEPRWGSPFYGADGPKRNHHGGSRHGAARQ